MHDHGGGAGAWPALAVLVVALPYLAGGLRLHRRGDRWPAPRWLAATGGVAATATALALPAAPFAVHVVAHLLLAMLAPLLLALAAPVTLALRALPPGGRRRLLRVLHSGPARLLIAPPVVLVLELGGMAAFYLTDLFALAHAHPPLMALVHLHMVLAGLLLAVLLVGADPLPRRPGLVGCLLTLLVAAAGHDVLAKLMYARALPAHGGTPEEIRLGAQVMYHGGTALEIALAVAVMAGWYARGGRAMRRELRRSARAPGPAATPAPG
ncbi:cytochrome c oxidase assembly protein [Actinomycetospora lutea]|uniref:cytochrome c oxidase assembly protein n=1 Tax=Actinomycetospora lutea TaxID=663604 RepID=UPI0023651532|nr:cytochrome c oxidase assembly protein [Actinomycetospora lutea]MDD7937935.1 cytochrome c oxidase assembly protein [Actinomycetospora lutea]